MKVITITLNPALDQTMYFKTAAMNRTNRTDPARPGVLSPGGKGINVSRILKALYGIDATAYGFAGGFRGETLKRLLDREGVPYEFTETRAETRMNLKIISADGEETEFNEAGGPVRLCETEALFSKIDQILDSPGEEKPDCAVISGSYPQGVDNSVYNFILQKCSQKKIRTYLDCDKEALQSGVLAKPFLIKPNKKELEVLSGKVFSTKEDILRFCRSFFVEKGVGILCTLGKDGAVLAGGDGVFSCNSPAVTLRGFSGAGDTFLASFLYRYETEKDPREALRTAAAAAAAKVECPGTQMPDPARARALQKEVMVKEYQL